MAAPTGSRTGRRCRRSSILPDGCVVEAGSRSTGPRLRSLSRRAARSLGVRRRCARKRRTGFTAAIPSFEFRRLKRLVLIRGTRRGTDPSGPLAPSRLGCRIGGPGHTGGGGPGVRYTIARMASGAQGPPARHPGPPQPARRGRRPRCRRRARRRGSRSAGGAPWHHAAWAPPRPLGRAPAAVRAGAVANPRGGRWRPRARLRRMRGDAAGLLGRRPLPRRIGEVPVWREWRAASAGRRSPAHLLATLHESS